MLTFLRHIARLLAQRAQRSLFAYDGGTMNEGLKPCRYCSNWVPAKTRVCTHCDAIFVD